MSAVDNSSSSSSPASGSLGSLQFQDIDDPTDVNDVVEVDNQSAITDAFSAKATPQLDAIVSGLIAAVGLTEQDREASKRIHLDTFTSIYNSKATNDAPQASVILEGNLANFAIAVDKILISRYPDVAFRMDDMAPLKTPVTGEIYETEMKKLHAPGATYANYADIKQSVNTIASIFLKPQARDSSGPTKTYAAGLLLELHYPCLARMKNSYLASRIIATEHSRLIRKPKASSSERSTPTSTIPSEVESRIQEIMEATRSAHEELLRKSQDKLKEEIVAQSEKSQEKLKAEILAQSEKNEKSQEKLKAEILAQSEKNEKSQEKLKEEILAQSEKNEKSREAFEERVMHTLQQILKRTHANANDESMNEAVNESNISQLSQVSKRPRTSNKKNANNSASSTV